MREFLGLLDVPLPAHSGRSADEQAMEFSR
jgi:hypothetical protein